MITLTFDIFTIIASAVLLLIGALTPLLNPFFRFRRKIHNESGQAGEEDDNLVDDPASTAEREPFPSLSLILSPYDDAGSLARNLPSYLAQDYPSDYQVVVVIDQGDHDTDGMISELYHQHRQEHPESRARLYVTYMPKSSRYLSRKKLAITLGVKAATSAWILLLETTCRPSSDQWLRVMAQQARGDANLIQGVVKYADETPGYRRFERLYMAHYLMREDAKGTAYRSLHGNLMLRKIDFLDHEGFLGNLHLMRGEYDFLVNDYAEPQRTRLVTDGRAWLIEDEPTDKQWNNRHIFYLETRKYLQRSGRHRWLYRLDQTMLHLCLLLILAGMVVGALMSNWLLLAAAVLALIVTWTLRALLAGRALSAFGETMSSFRAVGYELSLVWHSLGYMLRYRMADKRDFTTHKL